jgi:hypothetical protein
MKSVKAKVELVDLLRIGWLASCLPDLPDRWLAGGTMLYRVICGPPGHVVSAWQALMPAHQLWHTHSASQTHYFCESSVW